MAEVQINTANNKIFPELIVATNGLDLGVGSSNLFRLTNVSPQQLFVPLNYSLESVASITAQMFIDGLPKTNEMPTDSLGGITKPVYAHPEHELGYAFKTFKLAMNNGSGGTSTDFRSRLEYMIDARTTARIIAEKVRNLQEYNIGLSDPQEIAKEIAKNNPGTLGARDIEAIKILWQEKKIDVLKRILIGNATPPLWSDFLKIHEVTGTRVEAIKKTLTATASDSPVIDLDVPEGLVATFEGYHSDVEAQSKVGEVTVKVTRDDDKPLFTFDPACFIGSQTHQEFHVHAFNHLLIESSTNASTSNFKQYVGVTLRRPGTAFKAKMLEFSPNALPIDKEPSEVEERIIEDQYLRELARTGIIAIG